MTFLEPFSEPRPKPSARAEKQQIPPWTVKRAIVIAPPLAGAVATGAAGWAWWIQKLIVWQAPAIALGITVIAFVWSLRQIASKRVLKAIDYWERIALVMPEADKLRYGSRLDDYSVAPRGGVVVVVSPLPPLDQAGLDKVGHSAATAMMARAEAVEVVRNPNRLRRGNSARFGFVPR